MYFNLLNKIFTLCIILITFSIPAVAHSEGKILIYGDKKISELYDVITRMLDRQEAVENEIINLNKKWTNDVKKYSDKVDKINSKLADLQNSLIVVSDLQAKSNEANLKHQEEVTFLENEIRNLKDQIAKTQAAVVNLNDLNNNFDEQNETNQQTFTSLSNDIKILKEIVAALTEKQDKANWLDRLKVLKNQDGNSVLLNLNGLSKIDVELPNYENCQVLGEWLVRNAPNRDVNRFYVVQEGQYKICRIVNESWMVVSLNGNEKSHIIYE